MKLAVIADVHSNLQALGAVLQRIQEIEPEHTLCLGDVVGYGANPNEVVQRLKDLENLICVKGNHDEAVLGGKVRKMNPQASEAVRWTIEEIKNRNLEFLEDLDEYKALNFDNLSFFLAHGSPDDHLDEYIYEGVSEEKLKQFFEKTEAHTILLGHTHMPFVKEIGVKTLLNPGAVGQPRDKDRRGSYAVIDTDEMEIKINRVSYDVEAAAEAIKRTGLPDSLGERLYYGR